ncbi:hypothetical protein HNQ51_003818 [Inhella inkyongensis]|uniref:Uncharacterized protein n=1 Tax=Inhella inkyongensis TaxID=392593 RepID=A0A840SDG6_9BURK|nr:hypothetical protein [Inhella inkyongensis]MBB5206471.1 hypothetical protein [Inhella inkyongensis]
MKRRATLENLLLVLLVLWLWLHVPVDGRLYDRALWGDAATGAEQNHPQNRP